MPHFENENKTPVDQISAAFFCPQNRPPKAAYFEQVRQYLLCHPALTPFVQAIKDLPEAWSVYAQANADIASLEQGIEYTTYFREWISGSDSAALPLLERMSGIIALPLLTVLQVAQYFQYLEARAITHAQFLDETREGGVQGFCGGLLPAVAIAAASNDQEMVRYAGVSLRIALGIGAYGELGDEPAVTGPTTMALGLKEIGQADSLVTAFPGTYVSAVSDPLSVSVVGPAKRLAELKKYAEAEGVLVTELFLRGKVHNPENGDLCTELCNLVTATPGLQLPDSAALLVPLRSNMTGNILKPGVSLSHEIVRSTLVSRCEWYTLLEALAVHLRTALPSQFRHEFAMFGTGGKNCVGPMAFEKQGLKITKQDVVKYVDKKTGAAAAGARGPSLDQFPSDSIAIVGAACRLPGAKALDELWESVLKPGISRAAPIPASRFDPSRVPRNAAADDRDRKWYGNFIDDPDMFDNTFFGVSPREALFMDPQQRLLLETAYEALDASGYMRSHCRDDFDRVGCFLGSTYTEYLENTSAYSPTAYTATGTIRAFQSGKISYFFGWSGPSEVIDTACSSSMVAIHRACRAIQAGECPMALAGGVNVISGMHNFLDLGKSGFLSRTGQCKPFSAAADGYCRADGVGLVVLKSLREAVAQDDHVLGVIPSVVTNHGGLSPSITVPYSRAQTELFTRVLGASGLSKAQLSYVESHGTGTQAGDPIEIGSIREVFGDSNREEPLYIGSLKANIGHSEVAAGVGSLLKVLSMMQQSQLPPMAGFQSLNPKIPPLEPDGLAISTEVLPWKTPFKATLINSYGAAGSNSAMLCCNAPISNSSSASPTITGMQHPIFLSADCAESLHAYAARLAGYIQKTPNVRLSDLSFTLYQRRKHHKVRWVGNHADLDTLVQDLQSGLTGSFEISGSKKEKAVVLVFSGQSKQNVGLEQSWYRSFPRLRQYLHECNDMLTALGYPAILPVLFQVEAVTDIVALQCGTFAVQYATAKCWLDSGVRVEALVGHSFGELTALVISGVLSLEDGLKLVAGRASLMQTRWGTERGTMLAVHASRSVVQDLVASVSGLEIACFNSPNSQVVVGSEAAIGEAEQALQNGPGFQRIRYQRVNVSHGFHSKFTQPILEPLQDLVESMTFQEAHIPLETSTELHMESITSAHVTQHARNPVYFDEAIARLEERLGPCIWLEAGANSPIIPMAKKAVRDASQHTFIAGSSGTAKNHEVAAMTAALWREGTLASFWAHISAAESGIRAIWLPPYQFRQNRHWLAYNDYVDTKPLTNGLGAVSNLPPSRPKLVTPRSRSQDSWASLCFDIHQDTRRYTDIVSGHAVRGRPLCPASLYMEAAVMAAQMIEPGPSAKAVRFENLVFQGALGINHGREVVLDMEGAGEYLTWNFSVHSSVRQQKARPTVHAKGRFGITSPADWQVYSRVIAGQAETLRANPSADRLTASRAYTLFSRVVNYGDVLRGIQQVFMVGNQAVADVVKPQVSLDGVDESTAVQVCDAVSLDTFIQVAGLLVNSSERCPSHEVYIATRIDSITVQGCNFTADNSRFTVYVMATPAPDKGDAHVALDVFVLDQNNTLVMTASGVQFTRYPIAKLEKVFEHSGLNLSAHKPSAPAVIEANERQDQVVVNGGTDEQAHAIKAQLAHPPKLMDVLQNMESLRQLGIDSLAVPKLASHLATALGYEVTESTLVGDVTVDAVEPAVTIKAGAQTKTDRTDLRMRQRILELISENSGAATGDLEETACLQDIGIDSLSVIELRSSLEGLSGKRFDHDELDLGSTVSEILKLMADGSNGVGKMDAYTNHLPTDVVAF
ncbi:hypothetical protein S40288_07158 [Stachybotrys chartarum IBT 40288]|nr:hypothetical protein S40288_07158 [Stachybotrys chartarum IBT 40288]